MVTSTFISPHSAAASVSGCLSSRMNVLLSLGFIVMMSSCCDPASGNAGSHEEESTGAYDDDYETATPDYDYNATFDYYYMTGVYRLDVRNEAAGIGPLRPLLLLGLVVRQIWN